MCERKRQFLPVAKAGSSLPLFAERSVLFHRPFPNEVGHQQGSSRTFLQLHSLVHRESDRAYASHGLSTPDVGAGFTVGADVTAGGGAGAVPEVDVGVTPEVGVGVVPEVGAGVEPDVPPVVGVAPPAGAVPVGVGVVPPAGAVPVVGVTVGDDVGVPPGVNTMVASKWPVSALSS